MHGNDDQRVTDAGASIEEERKMMNTRQIEKKLETRLNRQMHKNPPSVLSALNISTGWLGEKITVTWIGGKFYAGAGSDEFCKVLGCSEQECDTMLSSLGL